MRPALAEKALEWLLLFLSDFPVSLSPIRTETMRSPFSQESPEWGSFSLLGWSFPAISAVTVGEPGTQTLEGGGQRL